MNEENQKPIEIILTDIQLHSNKNNHPQSFKRKIEKSLKNGNSGRYYSGEIKMDADGKLKFIINLPEEALGRDVVFTIPDGGLPIYLGKDSMEKIKSLRNKKII
jgi:hypothetical protein